MRINVQKVYVELDCLLDTRFTVLKDMNEKLADEILLNGKYHKRETDIVKGIDYTTFVAKHKEYSLDVLSRSFLTNIILVLKDFADALEIETAKINVPMRYEFVVNYFPYKLSQQEIDEIQGCLQSHLPLPSTVEMVSYDYDHLTPLHCRESYVKMFMYRYYEWIDKHVEALKECMIPGVTLYGPAVIFVEGQDEEAVSIIKKEDVHPMKLLMLALSPLIGLKLIDANNFSIITRVK